MVGQQIPDWADEVGPGWHGLLAALHGELTQVAPDYQVGQLKEKFGGLRVYLDRPDARHAEATRLVKEAEAESLRTCEGCGNPGRPRPGGWVKTKCDGCASAPRANPWEEP